MGLRQIFGSDPDVWEVIGTERDQRVTFVCQTGSHYEDASSTQDALAEKGLDSRIVIPSAPLKFFSQKRSVEQRRQEIFSQSNIVRAPSVTFLTNQEIVSKSDMVIFFNDWGHTLQLVESSRAAGRLVVGWVEGFQDFLNEDSERELLPYERCDVVFTATAFDAEYFGSTPTFLVGNQYRWKMLQNEEPAVKFPFLVNLNFAYGYKSQMAKKWASDVLACDQGQQAIFVSKHPATRVGRGRAPNSVGPLKVSLPFAGALITRSGTALLDALALGKPIIFYNPFGERAHHYLFDDLSLLREPRSPDDLLNAIEEVKSIPQNRRLNDHLMPPENAAPAEAASEAITCLLR